MDNNTLAAQLTAFGQRLLNVEAEIKRLKEMVGETDTTTRVHLYVQQHGWTSAPNPEHEIGPKGKFGQRAATLSIGPGDYVLLDTHEVQTADYGTVRWIQIRTTHGDQTITDDGFTWMPVDPKVLDAEALYRDLQAQVADLAVDDYTTSIWEE